MAEILAPAGDKNSVYAAVYSGADAIYLGMKSFSARSSAENFDFESFEEISAFCRSFGVKVYVVMNTLVKDSELKNFIDTAIEVWNKGADAIIVSDIFLGRFLKKNFPEMIIHLSTQAGVCNAYGAAVAKEYGFDRVILARETSLADIREIAKIIETEVFIQGALCTCFSGQCYLSSFAGGNSGNRGKCKQPCRKKYAIDRKWFEESAYRLSLSDLSVGNAIEDLKEAGVYSFKIEGRMRRPEYVAAAVKYYKNLLVGLNDNGGLSDLKRTYNRGNYTKGLAFGQDKSFISSAVQGHIGEFVGTVKVLNGKYICQGSGKFNSGDCFKILRDGEEICGAVYGGQEKSGFILSSKIRLKNGDKVFITTDALLNQKLLSLKKSIPITLKCEFYVGKKSAVTVNGVTFFGENTLEKAESRPIVEVDIKTAFSKVDKYPFEIYFEKIETDGVFIKISDLNAFRRKVFKEYFERISHSKNVKYEHNYIIPTIENENNCKISAICTNLCNVSAQIGILKLSDFNIREELFKNFKGEKFIYLPPFLTGEEVERLKEIIKDFDGIYCDGVYGFKLAGELKKPLFTGTGLNISNSVSVNECPSKYIALSKELTIGEQRPLIKANTFSLVCGGLKVMDLIYCPFERKCASCDKRDNYVLTDENGRKFPLRRYRTSECRFELYNCANLAATCETGAIVDCTLQTNPEELIKLTGNCEKLKKYFSDYTNGHSVQPIN